MLKELAKAIGDNMVNIMLAVKDDIATISFMPVSTAKDKAISTQNIRSLVFTVPVEDIDETDIIVQLQEPMKKAYGIMSNIEEFEKTLDAQSKKTELAKKSKEASDKSKTTTVKKTTTTAKKKSKSLF